MVFRKNARLSRHPDAFLHPLCLIFIPTDLFPIFRGHYASGSGGKNSRPLSVSELVPT